MNRLANYAIIIFCSLLVISGCKKDDPGEVGSPYDKINAISGMWKLSKIVQVDEIALASGGDLVEMDITGWYGFSEMTMKFNLANGVPSTFELNPGTAPNWILTTGTWKFDNAGYPTKIILTSGTGATMDLPLAAVPIPGNPLNFKFQRYCNDELFLSYVYTFEKTSK